jgi:hypothetical protein
MNYAFHPDAEVELKEAIEWYETREPGRGLDFATQVQPPFNAHSPSRSPGRIWAAISGAHWYIVFPMAFCMLQSPSAY